MDTMPQYSSSPPPLSNDDEGAASEEDEFGDVGRFPAGAEGSDTSPLDSTTKITNVSSTLNLYTNQSITCINQPVEESQPISTVSLKPISNQTKVEDIQSSLALENGFSEQYPSEIDKTTVLNAFSPTNETGFADFSVFGEPAAHAWCCGFGGAEFWDGCEMVTKQKGLSEHMITSGQEVILDSEPKSFAYKSKEDICTKVKHCETKSSQDCQGIQNFQVERCHSEAQTQAKSGESHKVRKHSFNLNFLRTMKVEEETVREEKEKKEKSVSTLSQTSNLYDFEDNASCDEDSSQEEQSEDFEPNVSSLASQEDGTDTEYQTDDEEELRNYRLSRSFCTSDVWYNLHTYNSDVDTLFYQECVAQESSATFIQSECEPQIEDGQVFRCVSVEPDKGQEQFQLAEGEVRSLGSLPPSDSFADFCSAPEDGEGEWALFQDHQEQPEGFGQHCDLTSCQFVGQSVLHCQVQQLIQASFPELISDEESEDPVHGLDALLFLKNQNDHEGEEARRGSQWLTPGRLWSSQDFHSAAGLQYQWAGSHTNKSLLRCLGVDTRNIVFTGIKKQPVVVPAFSSHLGMLEPIKYSLSAVHFPEHTAVTAHASMRP